MDHRDEWFDPDRIEEQINISQQDADPSSLNAHMLHDLQYIVADDDQRLAKIRLRLIEHAIENERREPVPFQRYHTAAVSPSRPETRSRKKQSSLLVQLVSSFAAILIIASMLLIFAHFKPLQDQGHLHSNHSAASPVSPPTVAIQGNAAFLMDTTTGNVLVDIRGHAHLPIGNMAQIMTAVVAIDNANLGKYITIDQAALSEVPQGGSTAHLLAGDQIQLRDLLYALLLPSGDDAALVIARSVGGNTQNFVAMMNDEARQLQLNDTHFSSPYGSSSVDEYSSAADLTHLANYAMQLFDFTQVIMAHEHTLPATNVHYSYVWLAASSAAYAGVLGIKTNYEAYSGACIVFSLQHKDHLLIGTELGAPSRNGLAGDVKKLASLGSAN
jgi:D-alanyl-D-alanine carboxypeptidase